MKKACYEVNPVELSKNQLYSELSFAQKSIYRMLIDLMWSSEHQYKILENYSIISDSIGCEEDELRFVVDKLSRGDGKLLSIEGDIMDLDMGFYIQSECLRSQVKAFEKEFFKADALIELPQKQVKRRKGPKTLSSRIIDTEIITHPEIKYLKEKDRVLDFYRGWMPTRNFEKNGQVYLVSDDLIKSLTDSFPAIDLSAQLQMIFDWFVKNEDRRRGVAQMSDFVHRWCDSAKSNGIVSEKSIEALLAEASEHIDIDLEI